MTQDLVEINALFIYKIYMYNRSTFKPQNYSRPRCKILFRYIRMYRTRNICIRSRIYVFTVFIRTNEYTGRVCP